MDQTMRRAIREWRMLSRGQKVLVAVSGGQDSVALLHALWQAARALGISVCAGHVEHGIRGQASMEDALFVRRLCSGWGIPLEVRHIDVPGRARKTGESLEQAARTARYAALFDMARAQKARRIATAHHMDDQAETLLLRLLRGSGLSGLCAIQPVRADGVIRPLLLADKARIAAYCERWKLSWREDATNRDARYTRNYLRHRVMPTLREINPCASAALARTADALRKDADLLDQLAREAYEDCVRGDALCCDALAAQPPALRVRVLSAYAAALGAREISAQRLQALESLALSGRQGAVIQLPGAAVRREYGDLTPAHPGDAAQPALDATYLVWKLPAWQTDLPPAPCELRAETLTLTAAPCAHKDCRLGLSPLVQYVNADALPAAVTLRHRRPGDVFYPLGAPGRQTFKKYMIDKKIPARRREAVWLLSDGDEVLWAIGYGLSQRVAIAPDTRRILRLECSFLGDMR